MGINLYRAFPFDPVSRGDKCKERVLFEGLSLATTFCRCS